MLTTLSMDVWAYGSSVFPSVANRTQLCYRPPHFFPIETSEQILLPAEERGSGATNISNRKGITLEAPLSDSTYFCHYQEMELCEQRNFAGSVVKKEELIKRCWFQSPGPCRACVLACGSVRRLPHHIL
jgi:hypothetical protein